MSFQELNKEEILSFLNQISIDKTDKSFSNEKLEITKPEHFLKIIKYFSVYLIKYNEIPPISDGNLQQFVNFLLPSFIKLVLPTQNCELYTISLFYIGTICYFFMEKRKETCFFTTLSDLILHTKSYQPKNKPEFIQAEQILMYTRQFSLFSCSKSISNFDQNLKDELNKEEKAQLRPNQKYYSLSSTIAQAFYLSGLFIEIRKLLSDINFFNDNDCFIKAQPIIAFLKNCIPFMSNDYKNNFSSDLKERLLKLDTNFSTSESKFITKFTTKESLDYAKIFREISELSEPNSDFFNELYFNTINNLIKSEDEEIYKISISELLSIPQMPIYTQSFINNLSNSFLNNLIYSIKEQNGEAIVVIARVLHSKEMLPSPKDLFDKCSGRNDLYSYLFIYIQDLFSNSFIDELFDQANPTDQNIQKVSLDVNTAKFTVELLQNSKYNEKTKLSLIFRCLFNYALSQNLFLDRIIQFSKVDEFKKPIFEAMSSAFSNIENSESLIDQLDPMFLCQVLNNLNSVLDFSENTEFPFGLVSQSLMYNVDSVLIPQYFNTFKFLPISDFNLFWDLSVHSLLFFELIRPHCIEIKNELFESDEFSIGLCNCLISVFGSTNEIKYLLKAAIVAYSLNDTIAVPITKINDDGNYSIQLINKIRTAFNSTTKTDKFFKDLIEFVDSLNEDSSSYLAQFLSEIDLCKNAEEGNKFENILNDKNLSQLDTFTDDKTAIFIELLMITKSDQIKDLVNNSIILKLFESTSIFARTVISHYLSNQEIKEELIDSYSILSSFQENAQLGNYNFCKNMISKINISITDEFIYFSSSEIIELIFNEKIPVQSAIFPIFNLLNNCQTYEQYETAFLCLLKREPQTENLSPFLFQVILSKDLPSCLRNDKIISEIMKRISENPVAFIGYIAQNNRYLVTEYHPLTNYPFLHVLSQFSDFILDLKNYKDTNTTQKYYCQELSYLLMNLKYSKVSNIRCQELKISKLNDLYEYIPPTFMKYFKVISLTNQIMAEEIYLTINAEKSISYSLSKKLSRNTLIQSPPVLFIHYDHHVNDVIIDEHLDLSNYSSQEIKLKYKLSSIISKKNNVYIYDPNHLNKKLLNEPGFICYTTNASFFIKKIVEPIEFVIYKQDNLNNELSVWDSLKSLPKIKKIPNNFYTNSLFYDTGIAFMEVLYNPCIDWKLFKPKVPNFIDISITLIYKFYIRPLFDTFCDDTEFSEYFFTKRINILADQTFTQSFSDEIIRAAEAFPDKGLLMCLLVDDILPYNNIFFEIIDKVSFPLENKIYAISHMEYKYDDNLFIKFFQKFLKMPEITKEQFHDLFKANNKLISAAFYIADLSVIEYLDDSSSFELFKIAVENSTPTFISELLQKSPKDDKYLERIQISSIKLYNNKTYQSILLQMFKDRKENEKILSINTIQNLLLTKDSEFRDEVIKETTIEFPPDTVNKREMSNMLFELVETNRNFDYVYPMLEIYKYSFSTPNITEILLLFLFTSRPSNVKNFDKLSDLAISLPNLKPPNSFNILKGHIPSSTTQAERYFQNYTSREIEKKYELFFKVIGKYRLMTSSTKYNHTNFIISNFRLILQTCYSLLSNKANLIKIFEPLIYENMSSKDLLMIAFEIKYYPALYSHFLDKFLTYSCMRETYIFTLIISCTSEILLYYYTGNLFYVSSDNINEIFTNILRKTNTFIKDVMLSTDYNPKPVFCINYHEVFSQTHLVIDVMRKLNHEARMELIQFYLNIAYTIPYGIINVMTTFLEENRNLYNFLKDEDEQLLLSNFACEIFRECLGDRQYVNNINSSIFNICGNFLNKLFTSYLTCKCLNYKIVRPYIVLLKAILKLDTLNPLKMATVNILHNNVYIYNLLTNLSISNKVVVINEDEPNQIHNDELVELQEFFDLLVNSKIMTNKQLILSINKLNKNDEMFDYRCLLFMSILNQLPDKDRKEIIQQTFEFVCELSTDSDENDPIQRLFVVYLDNAE